MNEQEKNVSERDDVRGLRQQKEGTESRRIRELTEVVGVEEGDVAGAEGGVDD